MPQRGMGFEGHLPSKVPAGSVFNRVVTSLFQNEEIVLLCSADTPQKDIDLSADFHGSIEICAMPCHRRYRRIDTHFECFGKVIEL
jgi:hypothetical protein